MQVIEQLKKMKEERFLQIYESLAQDGFGPLDGEVAQALKFRPHAIRKLPLAKRSKTAHALLIRGANAELCYELFGSYLMKNAKDIVTDFLDGYLARAFDQHSSLGRMLDPIADKLLVAAALMPNAPLKSRAPCVLRVGLFGSRGSDAAF